MIWQKITKYRKTRLREDFSPPEIFLSKTPVGILPTQKGTFLLSFFKVTYRQ